MRNKLILALILVSTALLVVSCANIGTPDGGPYDDTPPRVLSSTPLNKSVNCTSKKITIQFDEYVKLEKASEKVVVTPPQIEAPNIRTVGKQVRVDLYDDLMPNTTYTIDFGDAIVDNNEGNPMGFYTYSFSTGDRIDTMEVSGTILNAEDLEPVPGILVGLYSADSAYSDTLFRTKAMERVGRTNSLGRFSVKGIAPGSYRAFALKDADQNYYFNQKSEQIAFDHDNVFETTQRPGFRQDTIWIDSTHYSKILMYPCIYYYPDNLVLRAFVEEGGEQHLIKNERPVPERMTFYFSQPHDTLPVIRGINFDASGIVTEPSLKGDTITYWLTDTLAAYQDTLSFYYTYHETDTLGQLRLRTDTLDIAPKLSRTKQKKEQQKLIDEWQKDFERRAKRAKEPLPYEENPYLRTWLEVQTRPGTTIAPNQNITLAFNEPIERLDTTMLRFEMKVDSQYVAQPYLIKPVEGSLRDYRLYAEWESGAQYRFQADSMAFVSILDHPSKPIKLDLRVKKDEEFGSIYINIADRDSNIVVQLLNKSGKVVSTAKANKGRADFYYLQPAEYYVRAYIDRNGNGKWDTGNYDLGLQPEEVFYQPEAIPVKAMWEVEQKTPWSLRALPLTEQKPRALVKAKAEKQRDLKERNRQREEELGQQKKR